jgi:HSP20 family protein
MKSVLKGLFFYQVEPCAWPLVDLFETGDYLVFEADMPGINPEDVSVRVYEDLLIVEGMRNEAGGESKLRYLCMERDMKGFRRVLKIPVPVNIMAGEASYTNGVMTVKFPKLKGKLINIKIERK